MLFEPAAFRLVCQILFNLEQKLFKIVRCKRWDNKPEGILFYKQDRKYTDKLVRGKRDTGRVSEKLFSNIQNIWVNQ